jgi:hypothetical protein
MPNLPYTLKVLDSECENAIIDFPFHDHEASWLIDYKNLFEKVSIVINGSSKQIDLTEEKFIQQFYLLYLDKNKYQ